MRPGGRLGGDTEESEPDDSASDDGDWPSDSEWPDGFERGRATERDCDARRAWSSFAQQLPYSFPGTRERDPGDTRAAGL